ncbi:unnamed protein product [Caretta caretta]
MGHETHTDLASKDSWRLEGGTGSTLAISQFVRLERQPRSLLTYEAVPGQLLHLRTHTERLVVNLINIYAPTSGPELLRFYQQASAFLGTLDPHECLVLGGDFNTTLEEQDHSGTEQCPAAADVLQEIVEYHSLVDVWRNFHPDDINVHLCPGGSPSVASLPVGQHLFIMLPHFTPFLLRPPAPIQQY